MLLQKIFFVLGQGFRTDSSEHVLLTLGPGLCAQCRLKKTPLQYKPRLLAHVVRAELPVTDDGQNDVFDSTAAAECLFVLPLWVQKIRYLAEPVLVQIFEKAVCSHVSSL
jgi:hypothetical protein